MSPARIGARVVEPLLQLVELRRLKVIAVDGQLDYSSGPTVPGDPGWQQPAAELARAVAGREIGRRIVAVGGEDRHPLRRNAGVAQQLDDAPHVLQVRRVVDLFARAAVHEDGVDVRRRRIGRAKARERQVGRLLGRRGRGRRGGRARKAGTCVASAAPAAVTAPANAKSIAPIPTTNVAIGKP